MKSSPLFSDKATQQGEALLFQPWNRGKGSVAGGPLHFQFGRDSIWTVPVPASCSWSWRSVLYVREFAENVVLHLIGKGSTTAMWLDPWHPVGTLRNLFGDRFLCPNWLALVSSIVEDGKP